MEIPAYSDDIVTIRIFKDSLIDERMYLIVFEDEGIVIDPHEDNDLVQYITYLKHITVLLTHEHYDHISGVNWIRKIKPCLVYASKQCAEKINDINNDTVRFPLLFIGDAEKYRYVKKHLKLPYVCEADRSIEGAEYINAPIKIYGWITKGHSAGGMSFLILDRYLFSGDNLLESGMSLKSIGANAQLLYNTILEYEKLGAGILVFPGHGEINSLSYYLDKTRGFYKWS